MKLKQISISFLVGVAAIGLTLNSCESKKVTNQNWEPLLDMSLSQWDKFIGVPHYTVDLEGYEKGNGMKGTPIGLNNDPLNVFSAVEMDGEAVLKISGEIYGGLTSKKEYENYHLRMMVKWGTQKYEPRLDQKKDSGILYHCQGPHGAFWNVWMQSQEMQVQEGDSGDYYAIAGTGVDVKTIKKDQPEAEWDIYIYDPNGKYKHFKSGEDSRCRKIADYERSGEWNQLDLVCIGDKSYHLVNGKVVMVVENSVAYNKDGTTAPLAKGKIQIQSEGAEVYYKDIEIRSISELPEEFVAE